VVAGIIELVSVKESVVACDLPERRGKEGYSTLAPEAADQYGAGLGAEQCVGGDVLEDAAKLVRVREELGELLDAWRAHQGFD
jgi:hypothetical protein